MRKEFIVLCAMALWGLLLAMTSCSRDADTNTEEEQDVIITFATGSSRADNDTDNGIAEDRYINSLRVLGYRISDGTLAFNERVYYGASEVEEYEGRIKVKTGSFVFIFIANEHSDGALTSKLDAIIESANNTLDYFKNNIIIGESAFDATTPKDIPMVAIREKVVVQGDNRVLEYKEAGSSEFTTYTDKWPVSLRRVGVKLKLTIVLDNEQFNAWNEVSGESNALNRVWLRHMPDYAHAYTGIKYLGRYFDYDFQAAPEGYSEGNPLGVYKAKEDGSGYEIVFDRIIVPEHIFTPVNSDYKAAYLAMDFGVTQEGTPESTRTGKIGWKTTGDKADLNYTLPRNSYLDLEVLVLDTELNVTATVRPWVDKDLSHEL